MEQSHQQYDRPTAFTEEHLESIASAYELPGLRFVGTPDKGLVTENAFLQADNGQQYFAKWYQNESPEDYAGLYRAAEVVAVNPAIPAYIPLPNTEGTYTITIGGRSLAVFPYIEHNRIKPQTFPEQIKLVSSMARTLGMIHATPVPPDEQLLKPLSRWGIEHCATRIRMLNKIQTHIMAIPEHERSDFDHRALDFAITKLRLLEQLPPYVPYEHSVSICHGDYHDANVLFDDDYNVISVIDWDNAGLADPYCEFLQSFITNAIGKDNYATYQQTKVRQAQAFTTAYTEGSGAPLDIERLRRVYPLLIHERLGSPWPVYQHYFEPPAKSNDDRLQPVLDRAHFLAQEYDNVFNFIVRSMS